ncbi:hypothetical protein LI90_4354 (plasmid) [Carbonactinospora thermoautotrophica]|uniref:Uncharacterized protein n=1 Tax=Carbonactinospora thermoautotrophica TaxID=1469144 RepID=A0A132MHQ2_9ACTN|nr:hypothetical protein [Carbonactinospora thermoautotrophica]KWW97382.1 hypothetical protein LI90_4354 [Carbonactinospora thermoautotrophica]
MTAPVVLGVDPGRRWTGLAVRSGAACLAHRVVERAGDEDGGFRGVGVGPAYLAAVLAAVDELAAAHDVDLVAVEGVTRPSWHVRDRAGGARAAADPTGVLGAAIVLGAVLGHRPDAILIPPGHNGDMPLYAYPAELVSPAERRNGMNRIGSGLLRHARSAYDIAGQAILVARLRARTPDAAPARTLARQQASGHARKQTSR